MPVFSIMIRMLRSPPVLFASMISLIYYDAYADANFIALSNGNFWCISDNIESYREISLEDVIAFVPSQCPKSRRAALSDFSNARGKIKYSSSNASIGADDQLLLLFPDDLKCFERLSREFKREGWEKIFIDIEGCEATSE